MEVDSRKECSQILMKTAEDCLSLSPEDAADVVRSYVYSIHYLVTDMKISKESGDVHSEDKDDEDISNR